MRTGSTPLPNVKPLGLGTLRAPTHKPSSISRVSSATGAR